MDWRAGSTVVVCGLLLLAGCLGIAGLDSGRTTYNATVVSVADGDTVDVLLADGSTETVRLLGVDTPEVHVATDPDEYPGVPNTSAGRACLRRVGENASAFVRARLDGQPVRLELDPAADRRGDYGRLLAYVVHEGHTLNRVLLAEGYARVYDTTFTRREGFESAAAAAREAGLGLWRCRAS